MAVKIDVIKTSVSTLSTEAAQKGKTSTALMCRPFSAGLEATNDSFRRMSNFLDNFSNKPLAEKTRNMVLKRWQGAACDIKTHELRLEG